MFDAPPIERIELVCLEHLDVGFTAAPQEVARREKLHLDVAIALCRERPDFRWTIESIWQLEQWLARTPQREERDALVALVKEGRIELAGGFANLHTATMDAELLLRSFEPADAIRRELGVEITSCVQDDVPGFSALLPAAMAGDGIRYFLAGVNTSFGGATSLGPAKNPFWWEGLDGSRVLTWVAYGSYVEAENVGLGVWSREEGGANEKQLEAALGLLAAAGYARSSVLVMASTGDNGDPGAARSILRKVDAWNAKHATPRISFTTPGAWLARLEQEAVAASGRADGGFPVARGDWSGHWEPVKANGPAAVALYRDAQALLPGAEALALRAHVELGAPYPERDLAAAFRDLLLYSEHSQAAGVGWPKLLSKEEVEASNHFSHRLAFDAHETLRGVVDGALVAFGGRIAGGDAVAVVANATPFARDGDFEVGARRGRATAVPGWGVARIPAAELEERAPTLEAPPADALFVLKKRGFEGELLPLDLARDGVRSVVSAGNAWSLALELKPHHVPEPDADPLLYLERLQPFGPRFGAGARGAVELRFTTAAGVESVADFLPGSLPSSFCTSGAIELTATGVAGSPASAAVVLLREPFAFQATAPRFLGTPDLTGAATLWIRLLERGVRCETRDLGPLEFPRIEPTLDDRREFHVAVESRPAVPGDRRAARDADLMRDAWEWRCPLVARSFDAWFPTPRSDAGTRPLVETSSDLVLPLSCRLARGAEGPEDEVVLVRVQEVGGVAAKAVEVRLALPGFGDARQIDLAPHGVATLRFARAR